MLVVVKYFVSNSKLVVKLFRINFKVGSNKKFDDEFKVGSKLFRIEFKVVSSNKIYKLKVGSNKKFDID